MRKKVVVNSQKYLPQDINKKDFYRTFQTKTDTICTLCNSKINLGEYIAHNNSTSVTICIRCRKYPVSNP